MSRIQVYEHESLFTFPDARKRCLTSEQLERLYKFNDENGNKYFTGIRQGIRFNSFVGVIQIGRLTLEILPKVDRGTISPNQPEEKIWRNALIKMLSVCRKIKVDSASDANLKFRNNSLLDLYFKLFLDEVEGLLRLGLIKKYHTKSGNLFAWKGRMDFGKNIQNNMIHQERFYTNHQVYDYEHLVNQILFKALSILNSLVFDTLLKDRVSRILMSFPDIQQIQIESSHFDQIRESRKTEPYNEALKISKMIILNYSPDLKTGQVSLLALLFDMNKLWEEYIYRMLIKNNPNEYEIIYQDNQNFWEDRSIKPDLVIRHSLADGTKEIFVIDTKWRIPKNNQPADDELKQMYVYNMYWDAPKSILLYPEVNLQKEYFGHFHKGRTIENCCKVASVSIFAADGSLNQDIDELIFGKLNPSNQS